VLELVPWRVDLRLGHRQLHDVVRATSTMSTPTCLALPIWLLAGLVGCEDEAARTGADPGDGRATEGEGEGERQEGEGGDEGEAEGEPGGTEGEGEGPIQEGQGELEPVCTFGQDQTCNDSPLVSSLWGRCNEDGTCSCFDGTEVADNRDDRGAELSLALPG